MNKTFTEAEINKIRTWHKEQFEKLELTSLDTSIYTDIEKFQAYNYVWNSLTQDIQDYKCIICGEQATDWYHYLGYGKMYADKVKPICRACHNSLHRMLNNGI